MIGERIDRASAQCRLDGHDYGTEVDEQGHERPPGVRHPDGVWRRTCRRCRMVRVDMYEGGQLVGSTFVYPTCSSEGQHQWGAPVMTGARIRERICGWCHAVEIVEYDSNFAVRSRRYRYPNGEPS